MYRLKPTIWLLLLLSTASAVNANITLPDVISNSMVLQSKKQVPIWGKADPGESVTVTFNRQSRTAVADKDGKWSVQLNPLRANAIPSTLTIQGKNKIELSDILVGEVWLVAGQS